MDMTEKTLESREVYRGRILRVREDRVRLPNGKEGVREVVEHPGGVGILALDGDDVLLVKQYRYAFSRVLTEIPAGKREPGEDPFVTAQRELKEEIGATAEARGRTWGALIASPGCYGETLYLFLACELTFGETHPDADEFLETVRVPFDEAVELCMSGELTDAKTVAAILKAKVLLGGKLPLYSVRFSATIKPVGAPRPKGGEKRQCP